MYGEIALRNSQGKIHFLEPPNSISDPIDVPGKKG